MKRNLLQTLTRSLLFVSIAVVCAGAQLAPARIDVSVPFDFSLAAKDFPAGSYKVVRVAPHYLALKDANGKVLTYFAANSAETLSTPEETKLVFYVRDGKYFLSEIWRANDAIGEHIPSLKSKGFTLASDRADQRQVIVRAQQ
jgi:hypothetical protein